MMRTPGTLLAVEYCSIFLYVIELGILPKTNVLGLATNKSILSNDIAT